MLSSVSPDDPSVPDATALAVVFSVLGLVYLALIVATIIAYGKIVGKAGYSPWWAAMVFVPIGNIIMLFMFAFNEWPIQRRLRELEQAGGHGALPPSPPYQPGIAGGTWSGVPAPGQPSPWTPPPGS